MLIVGWIPACARMTGDRGARFIIEKQIINKVDRLAIVFLMIPRVASAQLMALASE